jgi:hypothetical protein
MGAYIRPVRDKQKPVPVPVVMTFVIPEAIRSVCSRVFNLCIMKRFRAGRRRVFSNGACVWTSRINGRCQQKQS